ncbi:Component of a membrane-bound complex containing the Tor2p kinase [Neophaeococcomyces mojaviensis]|uniref:Component of a membrane-bound complex containing the Tor2p kinase n=1 Tax=Neophaeococcomyces mojaviensis TaxID=3383035 RepID=A0ACC3AH87_9EURO|nr:Component of a membrane-bound complex containing the Tor2p kinase [Knufia sp. JES_112]
MALSQQEEQVGIPITVSPYDGIGERLINVNPSILNTPGFRAAGWTPDPINRTYSPPIPTAVNTEYFRSGGVLLREESRDDYDEEGGMVTGRKSNDTVGPSINVKRRRRREQIEDDDSSDLSDESDEDEETVQRAAQQIRFAKMPARDGSGSSLNKRSDTQGKPDVTITSPSKPDGRHRTGSLGAVEAVKARARADTTTSSDMSSENEIDPAYFQRRQISAQKAGKSVSLGDVIKAEHGHAGEMPAANPPDQDDSDGDSVESAASSELGETVDSGGLLNTMDDPRLDSSSPMLAGMRHTGIRPPSESPKKMRSTPALQALPPPRPISVVQPVSLLSRALKAKSSTSNPIQKFAGLSGKGSPNPLWLKVYAPFSENPEDPFEVPLLKTSKDGEPVIVAEAIGLCLWQYQEENLKPGLKAEQLNVNKWVLRMVEDGEVEYDFPALTRTSAMSDFTMNNNRGARARSRGKPFDEFALVEASPREFQANQKETPMFSPTKDEVAPSKPPPQEQGSSTVPTPPTSTRPSNRSKPLLAGQPFASALANTGFTPADKPTQTTTTSTPRLGTMKQLRVRYFDLDTTGQTTKVEISTDSYIAEILDLVCRQWNLDKAGFVLKVAGTNTVAALDRTVEALGTRSDLDLVRKRFGAGPSNLTGSPGSASPNAPLLLDIQGPTSKKGKKGQKMLHPLAQKQDMMMSATNFKKYYVTRRRVTSFTQNSSRVLVFDGDFLHNMPADTGKAMIDSNAKTNSFAFADIIRCKVSTKHSKLIRVVVSRANESKRYDFEARTAGEAQEIVDEITKEMKLARG